MAKITPQIENDMLALRAMGKSQREIADAFQISQSAISQRLKSKDHEDFRDAWYAVSASTGQGLLELLMLPRRTVTWEEDGKTITETYDPGGRAMEILKLRASFLDYLSDAAESEPETIDLQSGWGDYESSELSGENTNRKLPVAV